MEGMEGTGAATARGEGRGPWKAPSIGVGTVSSNPNAGGRNSLQWVIGVTLADAATGLSAGLESDLPSSGVRVPLI